MERAKALEELAKALMERKKALSESVRGFDQLPDTSEVTQATITALIDISDATYWRWVNSGRLPKPRKRGPRANRTKVGELRAYLNNEVA